MSSAEVQDFSFGFLSGTGLCLVSVLFPLGRDIWEVWHWDKPLQYIYQYLLGVDFNDGGILYPKIIWRSVLHLIEITMHYLIICIT